MCIVGGCRTMICGNATCKSDTVEGVQGDYGLGHTLWPGAMNHGILHRGQRDSISFNIPVCFTNERSKA